MPSSFASLVASGGASLGAAEELDFILNYGIKYRLGPDAETEED